MATLTPRQMMRKSLRIASTPQDGRAPTRPFYNNPYPGGRPDLFIKTQDRIKESRRMFELNTGIDLANNAKSMHYPTEKGFFVDGTGKAFMQTEGKFYEAGDYNPDVHGLPVPLAKNRKKLEIRTA